MIDYTLVLGVDAGHIQQLGMTWPTWAANKPSLLDRRVVIFFDRFSVSRVDVLRQISTPPKQLDLMPWPPEGMSVRSYGEPTSDKWHNPQRAMMLAGFVFVPAANVSTTYWLKLDLDVVAHGQDDWINSDWFSGDPAIVSHPWGYTKPPDQMMQLDHWAASYENILPYWKVGPVNLVPNPGSSAVSHPRIISWCAFFATQFTQRAALNAYRTGTYGKLPVPSQDGYLWYSATRMGKPIVRANMKRLGWGHYNGNVNVKRAVDTALNSIGLV